MGYTITRRFKTVSDSSQLFLAGVCEHCMNPFVHSITVRTETSQAVGLFLGLFDQPDDETRAIVRERTEAAVNTIENYFESQNATEFPPDKLGGALEGFENPCPVCGEVQRWQKKPAQSADNPGPEERVIIFGSLFPAYSWAQQYLLKRKNRSDEVHGNPELARQLRESISASEEKIKSLTNVKREAEAQSALVCKELLSKQESISQSMKGRLLIGKKKQELLNEIEYCKQALKEEQKKSAAALREYNQQLSGAIRDQAETNAVLRHYTGKASLVENEYGISLVLIDSEADVQTGIITELTALPVIEQVEVSPHDQSENAKALAAILEQRLGEGMNQ